MRMGYMKKEKNWGIGNSSEKGEKMGEKGNCFPDGTPIDPWFYDQTVPVCATGREYRVTEHGIRDDGTLQTQKLQALIDRNTLNR